MNDYISKSKTLRAIENMVELHIGVDGDVYIAKDLVIKTIAEIDAETPVNEEAEKKYGMLNEYCKGLEAELRILKDVIAGMAKEIYE